MELFDTVSSSDLLICYDAIIVFLVFMFPFRFFFCMYSTLNYLTKIMVNNST